MSNDTRKWNTFQEQIFAWGENPTGNLLVEAGAGTGKTTTIVELYKRIRYSQPMASIQFMAFNKKIADELQTRGVPACTMNSFGNRVVSATLNRPKLETNKIRNICKDFRVEYKQMGLVQRAVDLMKAYLLPLTVPISDIKKIIEDFELTDNSVKDDFLQTIKMVFVSSLSDMKTIDFADQICYPVYHNMSVSKSDFIIIDEAQDMSPNKLELVTRAVGKHFICVGDPYQAIYGFAGADSESMNKIKEQFDPLVLSLPVTYRCGINIVQEVHDHKVGPASFEAGKDNHMGEVKDITKDDFAKEVKPKDFVLCRVSAPLVSGCFNLIKKGVRAQILGRDVGKKLIDLVDKIMNMSQIGMHDHTNIGRFSAQYSDYRRKEVDKLRKADKDTQADNLEDQLDCLFVFVEDVNTIIEIKNKIEQMFDDNVNPDSVIFSTIHKSKGLEADRVFCLPSKMKASKQEKQKREESNLLYVMITRAKHSLYWIK